MSVDPSIQTVSTEIAGRTLSFETGLVAQQADGAVVVRYGDSTVLTTVVGEREPNASVGLLSAHRRLRRANVRRGKIPGGFIKREGRPTEAATLAARLTDRPIRPLFPKGYKSEVQSHHYGDVRRSGKRPGHLSRSIGASAALTLSQIPWDGPIGAVRVGYVDGQIVINPTESDLAAVLSTWWWPARRRHHDGRRRVGSGLRGDARRGIERAHEEIRRIVDLQLELQDPAGKEKWTVEPPATKRFGRNKGSEVSSAIVCAPPSTIPTRSCASRARSNLREELLAHLRGAGRRRSASAVSKEIMDCVRSDPEGGSTEPHPRRRYAAGRPTHR